MSPLEDEYLLSAGLPRLIYVKSPAPDREPRLTEMLDRIQDDGDLSYQQFSDRDQLQSMVQNDLAVLLSERFEMAQAGDGAAQQAPATVLPAAITPLVDREQEAEAAGALVLREGVRDRSPSLPGREEARPWLDSALEMSSGSARASPMGCGSSSSPRFAGPTWWRRPSPPGWG